MTQKTFNILDFCFTRIKAYYFGIFHDKFIRSLIEDVPEENEVFLSGMWLYYIANANSIAINLGYEADRVFKVGFHSYVYLYRLE